MNSEMHAHSKCPTIKQLNINYGGILCIIYSQRLSPKARDGHNYIYRTISSHISEEM